MVTKPSETRDGQAQARSFGEGLVRQAPGLQRQAQKVLAAQSRLSARRNLPSKPRAAVCKLDARSPLESGEVY